MLLLSFSLSLKYFSFSFVHKIFRIDSYIFSIHWRYNFTLFCSYFHCRKINCLSSHFLIGEIIIFTSFSRILPVYVNCPEVIILFCSQNCYLVNLIFFLPLSPLKNYSHNIFLFSSFYGFNIMCLRVNFFLSFFFLLLLNFFIFILLLCLGFLILWIHAFYQLWAFFRHYFF